MPAVPAYVHRLADGIAALEALPQDWIDRRTLEEALSVGKWTAWRILKRCGATDGPGNTLVCRRANLITQLRVLQQDPHLAREIARRERVELYLDRMVRYASRKRKLIARDHAAEQLLSSRFAKLPPQGRVEERRGCRGMIPAPFPFPAHQTGRADLPHPAFRQTSSRAHAGTSLRPQRIDTQPSKDDHV
jgi:hypothetical protein